MEFEKIIQDDMVKDLFEKIKNETETIPHPNIIVCGKTGVGKSTLINSVFRQNLAQTGVGKPVTQHLNKIEDSNVPITLYDTQGLELDAQVQKQIREELVGLVNQAYQTGKEENYIHAIWYCIQAGSNRLESVEEAMISELAASIGVPVILVVTQCFPNEQSKAFIQSLVERNLGVRGIISVMAQAYEILPGTVIRSYGLDHLVKLTYEMLPEAVQRGFINAQKVDIAAKEKAARVYANRYIASTFVTGLIPKPCPDAPLLMGQQVTMLAHITTIFGLPVDESFLSSVISSLLGSASATVAGRYIVSHLLQLIPGVGTVVGGVISGTTAATLTASMARAYIAFMVFTVKKSYEGKIPRNEKIFEKLKERFEEELGKGDRRV